MRTAFLTSVAVLAPLAVLAWSVTALDPAGPWFAFVVVWAPLTVLGSVSHAHPFTLPNGFHRLRPFERDGRFYESIGVGYAKALARRGPITWFNPGLHLPSEPTAENLTCLDHLMRTAEASHTLAFVASAAVALHAMGRGWWAAAAWTVVFDVVLNAYPVALQRYNRSLLAERIGCRC